MLRANRLLHKACPELPGRYSVTGRVLTNSHNRVEKTYSYVVEYDPVAIDAVVKQAAVDAAKAREAERLAAEAREAERLAAEKAAAAGDSNVCSNFASSAKCDVVTTNGIDAVQEPATNDIVRTTGVCACETNVTVETNATITNVTWKTSEHEVNAEDANAPTVEACTTNSAKAATVSIQLKDLTVKDIKDKMVKPKVTEKNGFRQIDADSFGGIDPMDE